ncbi:electron transfer flavoprotein subunit beta/FixA family protein [Arthrobacter sp. BL-252-APC-1A]|uniref:electron transfer flavoprotein subunit beta/FixA family protein n=1 Tax=Arthrobacter sp. BL-252-APC-1A TaxID=2606622 RepID=UPI0012B29D24|nr:electron transfer flavoprotein subunit beta/FixA family protein [Arthrobacter sp. BL-252-APC-1A]MSR97798.1 electron transfer flavoprotein subunit beta/FixA family protein [Arthrobacter sp. BL-252-APC-1A]
MRIAVLIKQVPDTETERHLTADGRADRDAADRVTDEITERALETALKEKDADKGVEITVVTMGPGTAAEALRKALSMGADHAVHVRDDLLAGADALATARVLAAAVQKTGADLVIAGNESTDGRGGVVPAMIAEILDLPFLGSLDSVELTGTDVRGVRSDAEGTTVLRGSLPAVVSVTEAVGEARFPKFKSILAAKRKTIAVHDASNLGFAGVDHPAGNRVLAVSKRPARSAGTKTIDDGHAVAELAAYLAAEKLI